MKKKTIVWSALALLTLGLTASCNKDENTQEGVVAEAEGLYANSDMDSKTFYLGDNDIYWKKNDNIQVYLDENVNINQEYKNNLTGNQYRNSVIVRPVDGSDPYAVEKKQYGFYPSYYSSPKMGATGQVERTPAPVEGVSGDAIFIMSIPAQQILDNDQNELDRLHLTRFPRAARREANVNRFDFKNLCGILELEIKGNVPIEEISFKADEVSNGNFEVTWTQEDDTWVPVMTPTETPNVENTVTTIKFHEPVDVSTGQKVYIALPQPGPVSTQSQYYHHVTVTVTNSNYRTYKVLDNIPAMSIRRSLITRIVRTGIDDNHPVLDENMYEVSHGIFTTEVNNLTDLTPTRKVYIAPGNLQYRSTNWQFADQQWEVLHGSTYAPDTYGSEGHEWDLFAWSTQNSNYGRSTNSADYYFGGYGGDGQPSTPPAENPFKDWGLALGDQNWYTLSANGWDVLLFRRNTTFTVGSTNNVRFAPAGILMEEKSQVVTQYYTNNGPWWFWNGTDNVQSLYKVWRTGILIFPDDFTMAQWPSSVPSLVGRLVNNMPTGEGGGDRVDHNTWPTEYNRSVCINLTKEQYKALEAVGVVFLPATGCAGLSTSNVSRFTQNGETALQYQTSTVSYVIDPTSPRATDVPWLRELGEPYQNVSWISDWKNDRWYMTYNQLSSRHNSDNIERCAVRLVRDAWVAPSAK